MSSTETRIQALPEPVTFEDLPEGSRVEVYRGDGQFTVYYHANPPLFGDDKLWGHGTAPAIEQALSLAKAAHDRSHAGA